MESNHKSGGPAAADVAGHSVTGSGDEPKKPRIDWADPNVPVGNAPPMPRWPLTAAAIAWIVWVVFLVAMLVATG